MGGIIPILFTPFDADGNIDADGLRRIVRFELDGSAAGLIPGVGFNEIFLAAWGKWRAGDRAGATDIIAGGQALAQAVSGSGHEMSLHLRKQLMLRHGAIDCAHVRQPSVPFHADVLPDFFAIVDALDLCVAK